jgi:hypothetical protein
MAPKTKIKKSNVDRGVVVSEYQSIPWMVTPGSYIAGRAALDEADALEVELEVKWGRDRLRLLVDTALRERFDRQRYLTSQARWSGQLDDVQREARRMAAAWRTLDKAATESGAQVLDPAMWEVTLDDGTVATLVREPQLANRVLADGRRINVYTLQEIANMISAFPEVVKAKETFPGAKVEKTKTAVSDPLATPIGPGNTEGIIDTVAPIDGPPEGFDWESGEDIPF